MGQLNRTSQVKLLCKHTLLLLITVFTLAFSAVAQEGIIKGVVKDAESGKLLIGVAVMVKGSTTGVTSDIDGAFSISGVEIGDVLRFSYLGYTPREVNRAGARLDPFEIHIAVL